MPGVLLFTVTPGGYEKYFQERQDVDASQNAAMMKSHDTTIVGPPLK